MDIAGLVRGKIEKIIEENGYILDTVEYVKEDGNKYLRVIIDKVGAITIDDCVTVTNLINPIIDSIDNLEDNYILDVCSKEKGCD